MCQMISLEMLFKVQGNLRTKSTEKLFQNFDHTLSPTIFRQAKYSGRPSAAFEREHVQ